MKSLKGTLLIAAPALNDPNFARTVVFVAEHDEGGAFGLVLNRPGPLKVKDLWTSLADDARETEAVTFTGGPVQQNAVVFLHKCPDLADGEFVIPGVFLGSEVEVLKDVLRQSEDSPKTAGLSNVRVFCGYSGWGPGQLDGEMKTGGWLAVPADAKHVFELPPAKLWNAVLESMGGAYSLFSLMPEDPEMN